MMKTENTFLGQRLNQSVDKCHKIFFSSTTYRKMERHGKKCCQMLSCLGTREQSYRRQPRSMMHIVDSLELGFDSPFGESMYA